MAEGVPSSTAFHTLSLPRFVGKLGSRRQRAAYDADRGATRFTPQFGHVAHERVCVTSSISRTTSAKADLAQNTGAVTFLSATTQFL